jgi:hypothetical protein
LAKDCLTKVEKKLCTVGGGGIFQLKKKERKSFFVFNFLSLSQQNSFTRRLVHSAGYADEIKTMAVKKAQVHANSPRR